MNITSSVFVGGMVGPDPLLDKPFPQVAFIGRSNVGKSSLINAITKSKDLARTSSFPGRTQQINLFLINNSFYLVDLPGYGFAKLSKVERAKIDDLIKWYLFDAGFTQEKVVMIIDANIGLTESDEEMLCALESEGKVVIVVGNKIDKIKSSELSKQKNKITQAVGMHTTLFVSTTLKLGIGELVNEIIHT